MAIQFAAAAVLTGLSLFAKGSAARRRRQAGRLQREIRLISRVQQRRQFVNRFRQAQAEALSGGVATGAGLGSSAVQGILASQATQFGVATGEFEEQVRLEARAGQRLASAQRFEAGAGVLQAGASFALAFPKGGGE